MASALEGDKLTAAADRFKLFSVFLCDAALVKLMTSLVALSINNRESSCHAFAPFRTAPCLPSLTPLHLTSPHGNPPVCLPVS